MLSSSPKARWQGYEYYFKAGVTFGRTSGNILKPKVASGSIFDTETPLLASLSNEITAKYLAAILNSMLTLSLLNEFVNHTVHIQVNDLRLLPIVIPTETQRKEIEALVDDAIEIQKKRYASEKKEEKAQLWNELQSVQERINEKVVGIYAGR